MVALERTEHAQLVRIKRALIPARVMLLEAASVCEKAKEHRRSDRLCRLAEQVIEEIEVLDAMLSQYQRR
jgi:hypothetical protein